MRIDKILSRILACRERKEGMECTGPAYLVIIYVHLDRWKVKDALFFTAFLHERGWNNFQNSWQEPGLHFNCIYVTNLVIKSRDTIIFPWRKIYSIKEIWSKIFINWICKSEIQISSFYLYFNFIFLVLFR